MSRFRYLMIIAALAAVTLGSLFFIRKIESNLDRTIDQEKLRFSGNVSDAPPLVAFTSMAMGSFRGLLADVLWLRSENLKAKKSYFEMVQLARWITDLQPNYSGGTAYLAWNLAYNISVTSSDFEDRWYWVNEGIKLIRDKALLYNPDDPVLYKELSWIFFHKLGNVLDDANLYYKNQLAIQMTNILGSTTPDIEALAAAPSTKTDFLKKYPADSRIWLIGAEAGITGFDSLYNAFRSPVKAEVPVVFKNKLNETEFKELDSALRAILLREKMKLDPAKMAQIDRKYGKMDWRVPESQAIYWATLGVEKAHGKNLPCARLITQAMQAAFRGGKLLSVDAGNGQYIQVVPNLELADAAYEAYLSTEKEFEKDGSGQTFFSARINYLKDAIPLIYINGNISKAEDFLKKLQKEDGTQKNKTLDEFVMVEFAEDVRDASVKKASAIISGLIRRSILNLIYGDHSAALANERLARYIYRKYSAENKDVKRNALPPYKQLKAGEIAECRKYLPPVMVTILDAAIASEKAEIQEAQKM